MCTHTEHIQYCMCSKCSNWQLSDHWWHFEYFMGIWSLAHVVFAIQIQSYSIHINNFIITQCPSNSAPALAADAYQTQSHTSKMAEYSTSTEVNSTVDYHSPDSVTVTDLQYIYEMNIDGYKLTMETILLGQGLVDTSNFPQWTTAFYSQLTLKGSMTTIWHWNDNIYSLGHWHWCWYANIQ